MLSTLRSLLGTRSAVVAAVFVALLGAFSSASARTWYILPDGTGDAPTIQAGIDSSSAGDVVRVGCGTYYESSITMKSGICLRSETGEAECVIIDAGVGEGSVLVCENCDNMTVIQGMTITGGVRPAGVDMGHGGAGVYCDSSSVVIVNCWIVANRAWRGGGLECAGGSSPTLSHCVIAWNYAGGWGSHFVSAHGGGISCVESSPTLVNCTLFGNLAGDWEEEPGLWVYGVGGGMCCLDSSPVLSNCVFSGNAAHRGGAVYCEWGSFPQLSCCDIYGNQGGNWAGGVYNQLGINGNFSECPLFCDPANEDLHLQTCSPCAEGYGCGQIGTYGIGCACGSSPTAVEETSWSALKALYRKQRGEP